MRTTVGYIKKRGHKPNVTSREAQVLNLLSLGFSTADIATNLYISNETVKSHRRSLLHKVGARNVASLIRLGIELELIDLNYIAA